MNLITWVKQETPGVSLRSLCHLFERAIPVGLRAQAVSWARGLLCAASPLLVQPARAVCQELFLPRLPVRLAVSPAPL